MTCPPLGVVRDKRLLVRVSLLQQGALPDAHTPAVVGDVVRVRVPGHVDQAEVRPAEEAVAVGDAGGAPRGHPKLEVGTEGA